MRKAILLSNAGAALGVAGQPQEGIQRLRESLQLAEESGLRLVALRAAERLSGQLLHAGSVEQALALDPVLQEQLRPDDGPAVRESVHTARARLAEARGDAELAASMREAANRDRAERLAGAEAMRDAVSRLAGGVLRVLPEVDLEWAQRPGG